MNIVFNNIVISLCEVCIGETSMKKNWILLGLVIMLMASPCIASPSQGGRGGQTLQVRAANYHGGSGMHKPPMHGSVSAHHRVPPRAHGYYHTARRPLPPPPPVYRPYRHVYRPYYSYYPTTYYTSYSYYPTYSYNYDIAEPVPAQVNTVVVRDNYAGINTAANVINAAANVAATIRYLTW